MAGGPIFASAVDVGTSGGVYPGTHLGSTNSRPFQGIRCEASLGSDGTLYLQFNAPESLPSGTAKLRVLAVADATSGNAVINPAWGSLAVGEDYDTFTRTAEGNTTITWSAGDDEELLESKITLDADTVVAGEQILMTITFVSASWTLAAISTFQFSIIWE